MGIHHVEMDPVGARRHDPSDGIRKVAQVRIEDAAGDPRSTRLAHSPTPTGTGS